MSRDDQTGLLLRQFHTGDQSALSELVERDLPWVQQRVRNRLGSRLRVKAESGDIVQEAMLEALRYAPRFVVESQQKFRALMARIVENVLRDQHDFFTARRRAMSQEQQVNTDHALELIPGGATAAPSEVASKNEEQQWVRLALEFLDPEDRAIITMRQWDGLSYAEIGTRLNIAGNAARMRFNRALPRLADAIDGLLTGRVFEELGDVESPSDGDGDGAGSAAAPNP